MNDDNVDIVDNVDNVDDNVDNVDRSARMMTMLITSSKDKHTSVAFVKREEAVTGRLLKWWNGIERKRNQAFESF